MDFFDGLNDKLKMSEERWKKINELNELLKEFIEHDKMLSDSVAHKLYVMETIIHLLVEELKPMANASAQVKELQDDILKMLNSKVVA